MDKKVVLLHKNEEYGTNLKISFATDSRTKSSKSQAFRKFQKKNEQYKKRIVRFSLQFLKSKRLFSRPLLSMTRC